jgi:hypothetical protein
MGILNKLTGIKDAMQEIITLSSQVQAELTALNTFLDTL